jgi:hypothetical protein
MVTRISPVLSLLAAGRCTTAAFKGHRLNVLARTADASNAAGRVMLERAVGTGSLAGEFLHHWRQGIQVVNEE